MARVGLAFGEHSGRGMDEVPQSLGAALADRLERSVPQSLGPQWVPQSLGAAAADRLERAVPQSLGAQCVSQKLGAQPPPSPEIVKCARCRGRGSKGLLVCRSFCHDCRGTGEAPKTQLLELLRDLRLGDVDAAVVLQAISAEKRDDLDIVLAAVGRFPKALEFVSERLRADREVLNTAAAAAAALKQEIYDRSIRLSLNQSMSREWLGKMPSADWSHASTAATASTSQRLCELPEETASEWCSLS